MNEWMNEKIASFYVVDEQSLRNDMISISMISCPLFYMWLLVCGQKTNRNYQKWQLPSVKENISCLYLLYPDRWCWLLGVYISINPWSWILSSLITRSDHFPNIYFSRSQTGRCVLINAIAATKIIFLVT